MLTLSPINNKFKAYLNIYNSATYFPSHMGSVESGDVTITSPVDEVVIANLPMSHMYGLNMYGTWHLTAGFTLIVVRKFDVEKYVYLVEKYRVTIYLYIQAVRILANRYTRYGDSVDSIDSSSDATLLH